MSEAGLQGPGRVHPRLQSAQVGGRGVGGGGVSARGEYRMVGALGGCRARAQLLTAAVADEEAPVLVAAAWLHDIGYTDTLRVTGSHPVDGGLHLRRAGWPPLVCGLVAHHLGARFVAAAAASVASCQLRVPGASVVGCVDGRGPDRRSWRGGDDGAEAVGRHAGPAWSGLPERPGPSPAGAVRAGGRGQGRPPTGAGRHPPRSAPDPVTLVQAGSRCLSVEELRYGSLRGRLPRR